MGRDEFGRFDADKMGFNCVVGLPLAVHGSSLGDYLEVYPGESRAVFEEAVAACSAPVNSRLLGTYAEMCATTRVPGVEP